MSFQVPQWLAPSTLIDDPPTCYIEEHVLLRGYIRHPQRPKRAHNMAIPTLGHSRSPSQHHHRGNEASGVAFGCFLRVTCFDVSPRDLQPDTPGSVLTETPKPLQFWPHMHMSSYHDLTQLCQVAIPGMFKGASANN
jgi:hypothetical protein